MAADWHRQAAAGVHFPTPVLPPDAVPDCPQTEAELYRYVVGRWGVQIPFQPTGDRCSPWRAFADAYFARAGVSVWKASRGFGGKTFLLALLALTEATTLGANVTVLGGSGEQSTRVLEYMDTFWAKPKAPTNLLASEPAKRRTELTNGGRIVALTASSRSVRGPHPSRLRCDEVDEMDLEIFDAALGQPMRQGTIQPQTVASSTHHYAGGTFSKILQRAGDNDWPVYEWDYRANLWPLGWLYPGDVAQKRREVTTDMWNTEYELQAPNPQSRAIRADAVAAMFNRDLGVYRGANNEYIEIEPPFVRCTKCAWEGYKDKCPKCGSDVRQIGRYGTGADWARKQDWTVITTYRWDVKPFRLVAFERCGRMSWPAMVDKLNARCRRYRGKAAHDATGVGDAVSGFVGVRVQDVLMVGRTRHEMLTEYIAAIERGELVAPYIEWAANEHEFASVEDVYGGGKTAHLPDSIASGALAYYARAGRAIG